MRFIVMRTIRMNQLASKHFNANLRGAFFSVDYFS